MLDVRRGGRYINNLKTQFKIQKICIYYWRRRCVSDEQRKEKAEYILQLSNSSSRVTGYTCPVSCRPAGLASSCELSALQKLLSPTFSPLQQFPHQESGASLPITWGAWGAPCGQRPKENENFLLTSSLRESFHPIPFSPSLLRQGKKEMFSFNPSP